MNCESCGKQKFGPWTTICTAMVNDPRYMEMFCRCAGGVYNNDPTISAAGLDDLANEADIVGATRYAEAYRLVAKKLRGETL